MTRRAAKFRHEYAEPPEPQFGMMPSGAGPQPFDDEHTTYEYVGTADESKAIIQRIHEAVDETFEETGGNYPGVVVVGIEDYVAADAWIRHDTGSSDTLGDVVSGQIVTVPGRMIHVPKRAENHLLDYLRDD